MDWLIPQRTTSDEREKEAQARARLLDQERRVKALDRVVEVIQRHAAEDQPHAPH